MMRPIGFSTGALAKGDFQRGLDMVRGLGVTAIELSALRMSELTPLLVALNGLDLSDFAYVSIHLPVASDARAEALALTVLRQQAVRHPLIVHPDALYDLEAWQDFGSQLCVENMDKRKPIGRTAAELAMVFEKLPHAGFCFDIGHARQVDPTMSQASAMLRQFSSRLRQLHVSSVNSRSEHERVDYSAAMAFQQVAGCIAPSVPIILESPVEDSEELLSQVTLAEEIFETDLATAV